MKSQPRNAIENGFTAQLMKSVTPMPRQCSLTCDNAAKSIFTSMGMIISQIRTATGRLTLAISAEPIDVEDGGKEVPERDPGNDAKSDPDGEIAFESGHGQTRSFGVSPAVARSRKAASGLSAAGLSE